MGPDHRRCGGAFIYAERLERFISEAVLGRLESPVMDKVLTGDGSDDERARVLADAIKADTNQLDDPATMWADGEVSKAQGSRLKARGRIESRLEANRTEFYSVTHRDVVAPFLGRGGELRAQWEGLAFSRQIAFVKAVLGQATIPPGSSAGHARPRLRPRAARVATVRGAAGTRVLVRAPSRTPIWNSAAGSVVFTDTPWARQVSVPRRATASSTGIGLTRPTAPR